CCSRDPHANPSRVGLELGTTRDAYHTEPAVPLRYEVVPHARAEASRASRGAGPAAVHERPDLLVPRVVSIDATAEVDPSDLDEDTWSDDDDASVHRMWRLTTGCCDAEDDAGGKSGGERVPEDSGWHSARLRARTRNTCLIGWLAVYRNSVSSGSRSPRRTA